MTGRRAVVRLLGLVGLLVGSRGALAQRQPTIQRVGALLFASLSDPLAQKYMAVFRQRLRELGYVEGKTIVIDERFAAGSAQRLAELARELADAKMDVIVTPAVAATIAMRQATDTIPIVMLHAGNPIGAGLIASLARPGGNVTGTANRAAGRQTRRSDAGSSSAHDALGDSRQSDQCRCPVVRREHDRGSTQFQLGRDDRRGEPAGGFHPGLRVDPQRTRRLASCSRRANDQLASHRVGRVRCHGATASRQRCRGNSESGRADLVFGSHRPSTTLWLPSTSTEF